MRKLIGNLKNNVIGIMTILIILSCTATLTAEISSNNDTQEMLSFCFGSNDWTFS